ncbi:Hypothetical protein ABZS17H1_02303 [Kosakonia cowanii]
MAFSAVPRRIYRQFSLTIVLQWRYPYWSDTTVYLLWSFWASRHRVTVQAMPWLQAPALYALSIIAVFLCLAALYESWSC